MLRIGVCGQVPCVSWVMPAGHAWQHEAIPGMEVLEADGRSLSGLDRRSLPLEATRQAVLGDSTGEVLHVELATGGISETSIRFSLWFLGGMFAILGSAVLVRRPDAAAARWFGAFSGFAAIALGVAPASAGTLPQWALIVQVLALIGVGASCLPFVIALVSDQRKPSGPAFSVWFAAGGVFIAIVYGASVLVTPIWYEVVRPAFLLYLATSLLAAVALLAVTAMRQRTVLQGRQSWIALFGIGAGTLPFVALSLVPEAAGIDPLAPPHISVLAVGVIPVAFTYAILQHQLLGIRRLVHRGMVYGIASVTTLGLIAATLTVATTLVAEASDDRISLSVVALLLTFGVAAFFPIRRGARWIVDKLLYSDIAQYETFVDVVRGDLRTSGPTDDVITGIARRLADALGLESAIVFLGGGLTDPRMVTAVGPRADDVVRDIYPRLETTIRGAGDSDLVDLRWESESLLVMNLKPSGGRLGFVLLGPKLGGEVFVEEEEVTSIGV